MRDERRKPRSICMPSPTCCEFVAVQIITIHASHILSALDMISTRMLTRRRSNEGRYMTIIAIASNRRFSTASGISPWRKRLCSRTLVRQIMVRVACALPSYFNELLISSNLLICFPSSSKFFESNHCSKASRMTGQSSSITLSQTVSLDRPCTIMWFRHVPS